MYKNLQAEMARRGLKAKDVALLAEISVSSARQKLNHKRPWLFEETSLIGKAIDPEIPLQDLFLWDEEVTE